MEFLNTPDERFTNLPDYPFSPNYVSVGDSLRLHYIDEGPKNGQPILLLHGEPSWSFLYRKMIPVLTAAGFRAIAPDLIGFGKSSKPAKTADYTYAQFIDWTLSFFHQLELENVVLFGQDWGGLIGLRLVTAVPSKFSTIFVANTGLPTGDQKMPEAFIKWQTFSQRTPVFPVGMIIQNGTQTDLSDEVIAAYDAPFPDDAYKTAARIFPSLVPTTPDDPESENNREAWAELRQWQKPLITLFSDADPVTKGGEGVFQKLVPGAKGQPHQTIEGAGHFLQEDKGAEIAQIMVKVLKQ